VATKTERMSNVFLDQIVNNDLAAIHPSQSITPLGPSYPEYTTTKWFIILRSSAEDEMQSFVMPAWIAGTQVRKDASGDIHVGLDSSTPCWNDANRPFCLIDRNSPTRVSK
jgi:hypothetical protein